MDKIIIVKNIDGSCEIVVPTPAMFDTKSRDRLELHGKKILDLNATEEQVLEFVISRSSIGDREYRISTRDSLPKSRVFRDAWTDDKPTDTVDIDMKKAHEIKKRHFRELRKPLLEKLDVDYMRALENNENTKDIIKKKKILRDITDVKLPTDAKKLETFIPEALK